MRLVDRVFGKLHNRIVLPLLAASLIVGGLATVVAVRVVAIPIERGATDDVLRAGEEARVHFRAAADRLRTYAKVVAESDALSKAAEEDRLSRAVSIILPEATRLDVDSLTLVGKDGRVIEPIGGMFARGEDLSGLSLVRRGLIEMNAFDVIQARAGKTRRHFLAGVASVRDSRGVAGLVIAGTRLDDDFVEWDIALGTPQPTALFDGSGRLLGMNLTEELECLLPEIRPDTATLREVFSSRDPLPQRVTCPEGVFYVSYAPLAEGRRGYGVVAVMQDSEEVAAVQRSSAVLIALWSIVAVSFLVLLGVFVAHSVSAPIAQLAAGARQVAGGDLSPRIEVGRASTEIRDLARSFNHMTGSLRDQTDKLTKRLLELTTLYEMSKALGATLDAQHLLGTVLDSALKVVGADIGYVLLIDDETGSLRMRAWRSPQEVLVEEEAVAGSIGDWVVRERRPLVFGQRPGTRPPPEFGGMRTRTAVCVPMKAKDKVKGVITVAKLDSGADMSQQNVNLLVTIANQAAIALDNAELFDSLQQAYLATVRALAAAVDAKDPYTHGHSEQVALYAMLLAEELGLPEEERHALETAAYLHDIGKIGVKDEILLKPGRLDGDEMSYIRHHPLIGTNILAPVPFPWPIIPVVRHHHERWDGSGYPAGLVGEEIPRLARVLAIADAFEAMTSDRPYRTANTFEQAAAELRGCAGSQFDPSMVEPFLRAVARESWEADKVRVLPVAEGEAVDATEVQAIFVSVADALLASLRRLGGPRVATNFQRQMNASLRDRGLPMKFDGGHLVSDLDGRLGPSEQIELFKEVLQAELYAVERSAGSSIAEHFFSDAIDSLPSRHRHLASHFGLDSLAEGDAG